MNVSELLKLKKQKLSIEEINCIHDVLVDLNIQPTNKLIKNVIYTLPLEIKKEAEIWGYTDTVVRDNIWTFVKENLQIFNIF